MSLLTKLVLVLGPQLGDFLLQIDFLLVAGRVAALGGVHDSSEAPNVSDVVQNVLDALVRHRSLKLLSLCLGIPERSLEPVLVGVSFLLQVVDLVVELVGGLVLLLESPLVGLVLLVLRLH